MAKTKIIKVLTEEIAHIGVKAGWHEVVPCPDHCADLFANSIWVVGTMRPEPVRILEYEINGAVYRVNA